MELVLVELSIVIVVIGLIIAGVTAGQSLVKQASLQNAIQDISKYKTAINTFYLQFNALPGDMPNAASYWTSCVTDASNSNTCNGNGNKITDLAGEYYRFWQHLVLSGLIPGSYSGTYTTFGQSVENVQSPVTAYKGYIFWPRSDTGIYGRPSVARGHFHYRKQDGSNGPLFTPYAYALDVKIDDGRADSGWVGAEDTPCVTAIYTSARSYALDQSTSRCRMFIYW